MLARFMAREVLTLPPCECKTWWHIRTRSRFSGSEHGSEKLCRTSSVSQHARILDRSAVFLS